MTDAYLCDYPHCLERGCDEACNAALSQEEQRAAQILSQDVARCLGAIAKPCQTCRRREVSAGDWQPYIAPSVKYGECENYIEPRKEQS